MKIEICANSYASAINAEKAGADRIELCVELAVGGITPSYGLLKRVMNDLTIPVNVLIRPRSGDFTYDATEFDVMKSDIELCKKLGCSGIVSGVLNTDFTIDVERTKELIALTKPLSFTFHRAFDWTPDPFTALAKLIDMNVDMVLTSGQETNVEKGMSLLEQLRKIAGDRLVILPGGGVTNASIVEFKNNNFKAVHFSATEIYTTIETPKILMNSTRFFDETKVAISDVAKIENMIDLVN